MILASACFAAMAALVKATGDRLPAVQLVWMRCVLALPLSAALICAYKHPWRPTNPQGIGLRSLLGLGAMTLSFYGIAHLSLADQLILSKTGPVWIALLAPVVLGERTRGATWLTVILALTGCLFVLRPTLAVGNAAGTAVLAGALLSALAHMCLRRLSATDASTTIVFWFCVTVALGTLPITLALGQAPSRTEWLCMALVAVFATAGQLLMTHAYAVEEAPIVSAAGYANIVVGMGLGLVFWGELPTFTSWVGGGMIVASGLLLVRFSSRIPRPFSPPAASENAGTRAGRTRTLAPSSRAR